ncbi:MAG: prepilin-type N-terminal cleavage/methylation domain-containing protein [Planctomycetota bacterium]
MRKAFSLVEVMVVVLVIGILAAVVVPRFAGATEQARTAAVESSLGSVRTAIANFRARAMITGSTPFPTAAQLSATGPVLRTGTPSNPFNNQSGVQSVSRAAAEARLVSNTSSFGWNYFVDNSSDPPVAIFYANSEEVTTTEDSSGTAVPANML